MKKEYNTPNIGFTAFRNRNLTNMERVASDPIGIGSPKMDDISIKVKPLNGLPKE